MSVAPDDFKKALSCWATGVTIVTARAGDRVHGMTVSAFSEVSLDPPLVLVCVDKTSNTHLLVAEGISKSFPTGEGTIEVLGGVDLFLEAGERVAIVGRSGVGKSTLLHILGTLDKPTRGCVSFKGEDLFAKSSRELFAKRSSPLNETQPRVGLSRVPRM